MLNSKLGDGTRGGELVVSADRSLKSWAQPAVAAKKSQQYPGLPRKDAEKTEDISMPLCRPWCASVLQL